MQKSFVYCFHNDNTHIMNWANIESRTKELAITNDTNIWMVKFFDPNQQSNEMNLKP
jgi:hypothetical protein